MPSLSSSSSSWKRASEPPSLPKGAPPPEAAPRPEIPTLDSIRAELARRKLARFVRAAWHVVEPETELTWNWHIDAICEHLEAVADGRIRRLIISVPPGHMKSLLVSVFWPAWMWLQRPGWRAIFTSYAQDLALRDSGKCRAVIESEWYRESFIGPLPEEERWGLSADTNRMDRFQNTRKGERLSLGVGGKATGFRGDATVVDDPLNVKDRNSVAARKSAIDYIDKSLSSRLNDMRKGARVMIMQRLHEEDPAGHLIRKGGYDQLILPTEFEPEKAASTSIGWTDPRSSPGELLFPVLFPPEVIAEVKVDLGSRDYASQHQQRPAPEEGGIFKRHWIKYWMEVPYHVDAFVGSWDMTFKEAEDGSFVVGQVWCLVGAHRYLLDQVRGRMEYTAARQAVINLAGKWPQVPIWLIEDKANGPAILSDLRGKLSGLVAVEPDGSKEERAYAVTPEYEAGNVWIPSPLDVQGRARPGYEWVGDHVEELATFPNGVYDDQVDCTTQALRRLAKLVSRTRQRFRAVGR